MVGTCIGDVVDTTSSILMFCNSDLLNYVCFWIAKMHTKICCNFHFWSFLYGKLRYTRESKIHISHFESPSVNNPSQEDFSMI